MAAHFPAVTPAKAGVQDKRRDLPQRLPPPPLRGREKKAVAFSMRYPNPADTA
jgi:hypothetical protein